MLRSMTGYGESTVDGGRYALSIELKTVNNRFLKITTKIPDEISFIQNDLEDRLRKQVLRGSVTMTVRFLPGSAESLYQIDTDLLQSYMTKLEGLISHLRLREELKLRDLLMLPGVVQAEESIRVGKEEVLPLATRAMDEALGKLLAMRQEEGSRLEVEFRERSRLLRGLVARVKGDAPGAVEEYRQRLEERVNLLLQHKGVALSAQDVLREVALLAERSDVTEEVARLESHLAQFDDTLDGDQPAGRKLEFIVQEMGRESNTMGAKTASSSLSSMIIEIKTEVDRLREQSMNVE